MQFGCLQRDEEIGWVACSNCHVEGERTNVRSGLSFDATSPGKPPDMLVARRRNVELTSANDQRATNLGE